MRHTPPSLAYLGTRAAAAELCFSSHFLRREQRSLRRGVTLCLGRAPQDTKPRRQPNGHWSEFAAATSHMHMDGQVNLSALFIHTAVVTGTGMTPLQCSPVGISVFLLTQHRSYSSPPIRPQTNLVLSGPSGLSVLPFLAAALCTFPPISLPSSARTRSSPRASISVWAARKCWSTSAGQYVSFGSALLLLVLDATRWREHDWVGIGAKQHHHLRRVRCCYFVCPILNTADAPTFSEAVYC